MQTEMLIALLKANININRILSMYPFEKDSIDSNSNLIHALTHEYEKLQFSNTSFLEIKRETYHIMEYCIKNKIKLLSIFDKDYPKKLLDIKTPPLLLFYRGNIEVLSNMNSVAVIGSRNSTTHGNKVAYRFGEVLAENNIAVVSGLAEGIDIYAHRGSLSKAGANIAILATGMDQIYPSKSIAVYQEILDKGGCIFTEYLPFSPVHKSNFVYRDRLESGISNGIIVVEAALRSGTMHTAEYAFKQNKIIGVYVHSNKFSNYSGIYGNKKLLLSPQI